MVQTVKSKPDKPVKAEPKSNCNVISKGRPLYFASRYSKKAHFFPVCGNMKLDIHLATKAQLRKQRKFNGYCKSCVQRLNGIAAAVAA